MLRRIGNGILATGILMALVWAGALVKGADAEDGILGGWVNDGEYYAFSPDSTMRRVVTRARALSYGMYRFEPVPAADGAATSLYRIGRDLSAADGISYLFYKVQNDTTAIIARGMSFVRADSGDGLRGTWVHMEEFTVFTWQFGTEMVTYRQEDLDLSTGALTTVENRSGTYRIGRRSADTGWFYLDFPGSPQVIVFPMVYRDAMVLFDLTPYRSVYVRTDAVPTYQDYQKLCDEGD